MKTVFLNSSVFFSAVNSPTGGSAKLFTLKNIRLLTSPVVLAEVERNVRLKLQDYHLERFFMLVDKISILKQFPDKSLIAKAKKAIAEKDAVIRLSQVLCW
jgi:predicted nucleic acid-binding protein